MKKTQHYLKMLAKLKKIESGELEIDECIDEITLKLLRLDPSDPNRNCGEYRFNKCVYYKSNANGCFECNNLFMPKIDEETQSILAGGNMRKCDGCGKLYDEPNPSTMFGEFDLCPKCKNNPDIHFE